MFPPGNADVPDAVRAHQDYRGAWFATLIGPLVVPDSRLVEVGRAHREVAGTGAAVNVSVINTSGAGGLLSLAGRQPPGVRVVAVESALRDLDDLAGNAKRVVSAATALDEAVSVYVEIPYAPGWERAVETVEAAGLFGKIRTGGLEPADSPSTGQLSRQLSVLVEADLPFKATAGLHHAWPTSSSDPTHPRQHGFLNVLAAVEALVEGAAEDDAAELLQRSDPQVLVSSWDGARGQRVRRRMRSFGCCGVLDPVNDLVSVGLLTPPV